MHSKNWDDVRYVLAVVDTGTVSGAARRLGVNHATVLRRIANFESEHNAQVFDKTAQGYRVLPEFLPVIEALRGVEQAMDFVGATLGGRESVVQNVMRVTSTDTICNWLLPEVLADMQQDYPELRMTVLCSNSHMDLGRSRVDLTVRPTDTLPDDLSGVLVGYMPFAVYGAESDADQPKRWIAPKGNIARGVVGQLTLQEIADAPIAAKADTFLVGAKLAEQGIGKAVLPCFIGENTDGLIRLNSRVDWPSVPVWVACHADLSQAPRVRALQTALAKGLEQTFAKQSGLLAKLG